ncbi:MAG: hypothetical protein ABR595_01995 [Psychroflexus sp.]
MKENLQLKTTKHVLPFLGLALLLLFSPCKIRNFIQAEFGVPQTEVTNKSQTTLSSSNCSILKTVATTVVEKKITVQNSVATLAGKGLAFNVVNFPDYYIPPYQARNHSGSLIPFYILYQNIQVYS